MNVERTNMATTAALLALAAVGAVAQDEPNVNTATAPSAVYAAQATAANYQGSSRYQRGSAFDRFVEIWYASKYSPSKVDILLTVAQVGEHRLRQGSW